MSSTAPFQSSIKYYNLQGPPTLTRVKNNKMMPSSGIKPKRPIISASRVVVVVVVFTVGLGINPDARDYQKTAVHQDVTWYLCIEECKSELIFASKLDLSSEQTSIHSDLILSELPNHLVDDEKTRKALLYMNIHSHGRSPTTSFHSCAGEQSRGLMSREKGVEKTRRGRVSSMEGVGACPTCSPTSTPLADF